MVQEAPDSPRRWCFGCGDANPEGLGIQFQIEGKRVRGEFEARQSHQGFPGMAHGGIAAAAIDEAMGWAMYAAGAWAMTARVEVRYRRPLPLGEPLEVTAEVVADRGRVPGAAVDMGGWEGEFEPGATANSENDLDQGDFVWLVPGEAPFNPLVTPAVIVTNTAGPDNASVVVTQLDGDIHPGAGGFAELGAILRMVTTLADGEYLATVFIPFSAADIAGTELQRMNLTTFDAAMGNWAYASSANSQTSPGFAGPVGNRIVVPAGGNWALTQDVGDYGVFWDPQLLAGFVWANVDHEGDFAVGFALCPSDCLQTPDGVVGIQDLLAVLSLWGTEAGGGPGGPCDTDFDGVIGLVDFVAVLDTWGPCVLSSAAGAAPDRTVRAVRRSPSVAARSADLDGDGLVDVGDLQTLQTAWGPCGDCRADLDGDGRVDVRDMLSLLRDWSAPGATRFAP